MMMNMLEHKQAWKGGLLLKVNPQYTSQTCNKCGHVAKENRQTQAKFECVECGYVANADIKAACKTYLRWDTRFCLWREDAVKVARRSRKLAKSVRESLKS